MLLSKTANIKWNPSNREWYQSKGYKYTFWHEEFEVKTEDLAPTSQAIIDIKCDYCNSPHQMTYEKYVRKYKNNSSGKHSCKECNSYRIEENKGIVLIESDIAKSNNYEKHYRMVIEDSEIYIKCCRTCGKYKELSCFKENNKAINLEYSSQCFECENIFKDINMFKIRLGHIKESSVKMNLPTPMTEKELESIFERFNEVCALSNSINVDCEHFIPVSWGHGGTHIGNVYLLSHALNTSKGNINPFKWIKRPDIKSRVDQKEWKKLIRYLASKNKLTIAEFEQFVNWCEKNKRSAEGVKRDGNISSIELWKKAMGK